MNRQAYLRRIARRARRRDRDDVVAATGRELDDLRAEAIAEGLREAEAEAQAIRVHSAGSPGPWDPWGIHVLLTAPFQGATWRSVAYLLALFPIGLAAGIWATAGMVLVAGLILVVVGLLLVVPYLLSLRPIAQVLGGLASWASGQPMPMLRTLPRSDETLKGRIMARLRDPETLAAWIMCIAASALGQIAIAWVGGIGSAVVYLISSPVAPIPPMPGGGAVYPDWLVASTAAKLVIGLPLLWIWAWGCQVMAWIFSRITRKVLTRT